MVKIKTIGLTNGNRVRAYSFGASKTKPITFAFSNRQSQVTKQLTLSREAIRAMVKLSKQL